MKNRAAVLLLAVLAACGGGQVETQPGLEVSTRLTAEQLDSQFVAAQALLADRDWRDAAVAFERLLLELPRGDRRLPLARVSLAESRFGAKSYLQAVREFRRISDEYPTDTLAAYGLVRAGDSYAKLWRRPELDPTYGTQALATYNEAIARYPEGRFADTARARVAHLEDWFAIKQFKNASFYLRYKAHDSAILVLRDLLFRYPRSSVAPEALSRLIDTYRELGYEEEVQESCGFFRSTHPQSPLLGESCPDSLAATPSPSGPGD
ncbi:MAG TPA: outer membrane protein assembly factor BamD [Gemmatimonadales bacterium]|nr:outer membrane protein assembly factor BamD [Gemmatimonadales bacterium]